MFFHTFPDPKPDGLEVPYEFRHFSQVSLDPSVLAMAIDLSDISWVPFMPFSLGGLETGKNDCWGLKLF